MNTMSARSFLVFSLDGSLFAIEAPAVREILWLPELAVLEEMPPDIPGVMNLRGRIVPVMDLHLRFGHAGGKYALSNQVIVLSTGGIFRGIIVDEVRNVVHITREQLEPLPSYGSNEPSPSCLFLGVARLNPDIVMVLKADELLKCMEAPDDPEKGNSPAHGEVNPYFCPEAGDEERRIFRERAHAMGSAPDEGHLSGMSPLAVIGLNGEYFGLGLEHIREFSKIHPLTPIPCCPEHIAGNMNLRGNILTLIDVRRCVELPPRKASPDDKVVVVGIGDLQVGVVVDEVFDVIYFHPADVSPLPAAVRTGGEQYIKGTVPYAGRLVALLDLPAVLTREDLVVNEEV